MVGPVPTDWSVDPSKASAFEVRPGLTTLRLPLPWAWITHVNAYTLDRDDGGITLIDCGGAGHASAWDALVVALEKSGREVGDIRELVLTHAHSDHLGLAVRIVAESGCTMWMHPAHHAFTDGALDPVGIYAARERRALAEGVPEDEVHDYADVGEERDAALGPLPPFSELRDGTVVDSVLGPWRTLETPGHTPSHVCLYHDDERLLVVGDLVSRIYAPWFDYGYSPDPVGEFLASLDLVDGLDVELALPGHGRPIADLRDVVAMHRDEAETRLERVVAAVADSPGTAYDLGRRVFGEVDHSYEAVSRLLETMSYLKHLRATGRVTRETRADGTFLYMPA